MPEVLAQLDLGEPSQEVLDWAYKELGEDPDTRCEKIEEFRNLIFERGECTPHRTDDAFLLRFLRARYFIPERAHRLLCNYYDFKEANTVFFKDVSLLGLKRMGDDDVITVWPYRDQLGRRALLYRMGQWDPKKFSTDNVFQATLVILELAILEQQAQVLGGVCIFDLSGLTMNQAWYMNASIASKMVQIMVTCFPMKIHEMHIVNQSWVFDIVYNIFKPFLSDMMKKRIFFHGTDWDSLHKHIDAKHLPTRYGGVHPDYNYNDWIDWFMRTDKIKEELKLQGYNTDDEEALLREMKNKD